MPFASRVAAVAALVFADLHITVRAADNAVTPVGKVIDLMKGLTKEVQDEGKTEAVTYDKFACFCKTATGSKSTEITKGADKIDELSATIEAKSAEKKEKGEDHTERQGKQETMSAEIDDEKARCMKEERTYDQKVMDLSKAIGGIGDALKSMANSRKGGASALQVMDYLHSSVRESMDALMLIQTPAQSGEFLQQSAQDPEYKYHSGNIEGILKMLKEDYGKKKTKVDSEWKKTDLACKQTKETLGKDLKNNKDALTKLEEKMEALAKDIAKAKEDLVSEQTALADAQVYMKDLTHRCEARAKDWDQRSSARSEEVEALDRALDILTNKVKGADEVNKRALLLSASKPVVQVATLHSQLPHLPAVVATTALASTAVTVSDSDSTEIATELTALESNDASDEAKTQVDEPSNDDDVRSWLHEGPAAFVQVHQADQRQQVLAFVQKEGQRLGSTALTSLALRAGGDPFGKVKGLIQQLLERLLKESAGEATKKGFCDEEMGKAKQARDYAMEEANKLDAEMTELKVKEESLNSEADTLKERVADLSDQLKEAKDLREREKKENADALEKAQGGVEAVTEAYNILKAFYNNAGAAALIQASPVDEDSPGAPTGEYKGKQGAAGGILGLLQVIITDFERTLRTTEASEKNAHAEFTEMSQNFKADIAGHTTKRELDMQDAKTTDATIKKKLKDFKFSMDAVDGNLKTLEDLKPTCVESGRMSFKERTEKREEEMAALKKALCKLDTDGVEFECK